MQVKDEWMFGCVSTQANNLLLECTRFETWLNSQLELNLVNICTTNHGCMLILHNYTIHHLISRHKHVLLMPLKAKTKYPPANPTVHPICYGPKPFATNYVNHCSTRYEYRSDLYASSKHLQPKEYREKTSGCALISLSYF